MPRFVSPAGELLIPFFSIRLEGLQALRARTCIELAIGQHSSHCCDPVVDTRAHHDSWRAIGELAELLERGAAKSPEGKPIVCLASTTDDGKESRISPSLLAGEGGDAGTLGCAL